MFALFCKFSVQPASMLLELETPDVQPAQLVSSARMRLPRQQHVLPATIQLVPRPLASPALQGTSAQTAPLTLPSQANVVRATTREKPLRVAPIVKQVRHVA